jgi:cytochrome c oxidase subunit 2
MQRSLLFAAILLAAPLTACKAPGATRAERGRELYGYCVQCHGDRGQGNIRYRAPAIAGLDRWYVEAQLNKFRVGARGDHPDDVEGLRMRPMSRTLGSALEVALVSEYVANMPSVEPEATFAGDANHGRQLFEPCVQCHGERAEGNQTKNAPPLNQASDWYLVAQLQKFRAGVRGTDNLDATGAQMRAMAATLPDEQAMRDVVFYVRSLD